MEEKVEEELIVLLTLDSGIDVVGKLIAHIEDSVIMTEPYLISGPAARPFSVFNIKDEFVFRKAVITRLEVTGRESKLSSELSAIYNHINTQVNAAKSGIVTKF